MADNTPIPPLVDRTALEDAFGGYEPQGAPADLPNVAFRGLDKSSATAGTGEPISILDALENSVTSMPSSVKLTGGGIPRSIAELTSSRYKAYVPGDYNNEDAYAQGQGWTDKMVNSVGKGLLLAGGTFLQGTVGLVNGVGRAISDGRAASFYDNPENRALDDLYKWSEDFAPVYQTDAYKNLNWYQPSKLFSANFLWDGIVKNLGFAAGAYLSGGVYAAGLKALPLTARLFSVGKAAEALAATEQGLLGANKVADTFGKIKTLSDRFLTSYKLSSIGGRALVAGLSTTGEAGFEAAANLNAFRDKKIQEYVSTYGAEPDGETLAQINREAESVGNTSFLLNVGLLTATNYIQFPKILGSSYKAERGMVNDLTKEIGELTTDEAGKLIAAPSRFGKIIGGLNKARPYIFSASEGFEEGSQYAIQVGTQDYYNKKSNNQPTSFLDSLSQGITQTLGTNEGMENVLIGGLSGAIMQARGKFSQGREITTNTAAAIESFNKFKLSDFSKDTIDSVNRGTTIQEEREQQLKEGNVANSKDLEADYIINYLSPRIKYGRFDLVKSEIDDYRMLALTDQGFAQLQAEGKALATDTKEQYLERLNGLEATANNVKSLYQSLNLRYGGMVNSKGEKVYSSDVMDKMVYAASKVADYDKRIPQLTSQLTDTSIDVMGIVDELVNDKKSDKFDAAIVELEQGKAITAEEDIQTLQDIGKLSLRRDLFLNEYSELKKSPEKFKEPEPLAETAKVPGAPVETVTIKTKDGDEDIEIGTEYFLGRVTEYSAEGNEVYRFPMLTVVGENEDGTIQIKASTGEIRNVSKDVLADYKLGKVSDTLNNKKAKYFMDNINTMFEHYGIKDKDGKPEVGRLEYSLKKDKLVFVYKDDSGKIVRREVLNTMFKAAEGYRDAMVREIGKLTATQTESKKAFVEDTTTMSDKLRVRNQIVTDLYENSVKRVQEIEDKLTKNKQKLDEISGSLDAATKTKDGKDRKNFTKTLKKSINELSALRTNIEKENNALLSEKEELEVNIPLFKNFIEELSSLPEDSKEFIAQLKDDVSVFEDLIKITNDAVKSNNDLLQDIDKVLSDALSIFTGYIQRLREENPGIPLFMDELVAKLEKYQGEEGAKQFVAERLGFVDLVADLESDINDFSAELKLPELTTKADKLSEDIKELRKGLDNLVTQQIARRNILDAFEEFVEKQKQIKLEENKIQADKQLLAQFLGTMDNSVQNNPEPTKGYEAASKKPWQSVVGGTVAPGYKDAVNAFNVRANNFGFKFNSLENKDSIRGVVVTNATQDQIIPGLTEHLIGESGLDPKTVIALVMVQENKDGSYTLVDENGVAIPEGADLLNTAIFQVFPTEKLEATYDGKKESMFRESTPEYVEASLREQYTGWRENELKQTQLGQPQGITASFGIPQYVTRLNEKGIEERNYDARVSAEEAGLVDSEMLTEEPVIAVATNNTSITNGSVTFTTPLGRVFLQVPGGLAKLFNRKFNSKEANTIYDVILQLTKNAVTDGDIRTEKSQRLINWLKSTVYWGIAKNQAGERIPAGYNNVWFEEVNDEDGKPVTKLYISGKGEGFEFTPTSLEENKGEIVTLLQNMYNNTNATMVNQNAWNNPYFEITGIDSNGEPITNKWDNYQTYLLSSEGRTNEEIPLATKFKPITDTAPVNRVGIYFTLDTTVDDYVVPQSAPVVTPMEEAPKTKPINNIPTEFFLGTKTQPDEAKSVEAPKQEGFVLDGVKENTVQLGTFGAVTFTLDGKLYNETNGDKGFSPNIKASVIEAVMKAKDISEEKATQIITASVIAKVAPQLESMKIPVLEPIVDFTEEENDEWNNSAPNTPDDTAYRLQLVKEAKQFESEDWTKLEEFFRTKFPILPVYRVKNVINATNGRQAWGMLQNAAIYLQENAQIGTAYHEVFEAVWKMFATPEERAALVKEFRNREGSYTDRFTGEEIKYSEATEAQLKEEIAEEYRDFELFGKAPDRSNGKSLISRLFSDIVNFFKTFFTGNNAANNTEELFKKMSSGYYAENYNPYIAPLSFANVGVIDIQDAFGGPDAEYRLETIPATQVNEIMQQMTYSTLTDLIKTDKSLFTIASINKKELYDKLQKELLEIVRWKGSQYESAAAKGELTNDEAAREVGNLKTLYKNIKADWNDITAKHQEYLKTYSIEFDENDNTILTDENNSGKGDYQDARKIDSFRRANSAIKILLATLPVTEVTNEGVKIKRSSIGGAVLMPSDQVFINLMNQLHDSTNVDDMFDRLRTMALGNPNYASLYKRLTKLAPSEQVDFDKLDDAGLQLVSAFWKSFKRQNADVISVFVLPEGDIVISDSTLSSAAKQAKRDMTANLINTIKADNKYVKYDPKTFKYNALGAINNVQLSGSQLNGYTTFLNNLGIEFDIKAIRKLNDDQLRMFRKAVEGLKTSISQIEDVATLSTKTLNIDGRMLELGTIQAIIENPTFESTYFNINGERTQNFIGTNALSGLYDVLSKLDNINDLAGTEYAFLLTDVFSKGNSSVMLNKMFNIAKSGGRIKGSEGFMKPVYIDGTINEQKGKSKESSKLSYKERLIQEINLNLSGFYLNLVPGDASIEWAINMHKEESPFVTEESYLTKDYLNIFKNYFISEVELARDGRKTVKPENSKNLRFFKAILGDDLHKQIMTKANLKLSPEEVYENNKKEINAAVEEFIKNDAQDNRDLLEGYGAIGYDEDGLYVENIAFGDNITEQSLNTKLQVLSVNYMIANIEMHKLVYSDPYQYSDELKRIKNFNSPRQPLVYGSKKINAAFNKQYNKGYSKDDIGYTDMNRDVFKSSVISDVFTVGSLPGYEIPFEETDGGGYISLKANRIFGLRSGEWTEGNEKQYRYDIAWEKRDKGLDFSKEEKELLAQGNPNVRSTYTPIKPIVSGSKADGNNYNDIVLDKFALVPLSYRVLKEINADSNAIKLYEKMQRDDVDYVVYNTGRKVGAGTPTNLYDSEGNFNNEPFEEINNIPFAIMGVQTEVPSKDTPLVTRGSQITKLVTLDFLEAGMPIDFEADEDFDSRFAKWINLDEDKKLASSEIYRLIKENQDLLVAKTEADYQTLIKKLGIQQTVVNGKKAFVLGDVDKLIDTLRDEILKREVNENITDALNGFKQGDVVLEATPAYQQIRNILYSIADKTVVRPKISGGLKVQIPSTLLESTRVKPVEINGKNAYVSNVLKFYTNKEGERICEIMVGRWFKSDKTDAELLKYFNDTPEGQKVLEGIGFRIPTQKQNSIDAFKIAKFLPEEFGDSVVIPSALVKKVGSDFDIDKLSIYLKNIYVDGKGDIKTVPYFGIGEQAKAKFADMFDRGEFLTEEQAKQLDRYINEEREREFDLNSPEAKLIRDIFPEAFTDEAFAKEFVADLAKKGMKEGIVDNMYAKSLENQYIQSLQNLVSHPSNFDNLIKPNSADQLKGLAKDINKKLGREEIDYSSVGNMLHRTFMSRLRQDFVSGKYAIGIAAVSQTNHAQNQRAVMYIDTDRLQTKKISEIDKKWLGDGEIKLKEYNSIFAKDKKRPTLSMIKNAAGEYISDIIGQFIDGYVDISKGPWIMELGATPNVASTWLFLTKIGVPIKTTAYFMNQPIVRDYLRTVESAGYSWLFIDNFVEDMMDIYTPQEDITVTELPNEDALGEMIGKKTSQLSNVQKAQQQLILQEFLKYAKMAEHLFQVTQGSNFDTATINDPYLVFKKQMQLKKAQNTIISSVDDILDKSFIGSLKDIIYDVRDAFSTILISDRKSDDASKISVRDVMEAVLAPYTDLSDRDFVKVSQKAVADLFDWAVQTDTKLNNFITNALLGTDTYESAAKKIIAYRDKVLKDESHPLHDNLIINSIKLEPGSKNGKPDNLYIAGRDNKVYNQNQTIAAFRELREQLKAEGSDLYGRLVRLAVIQSGTTTSPISFTSILPYEDFKGYYNNTLSELENLSNLDEFYNLHVLERNNWNNTDIVPFKPYTLIKSKKGKFFNPNMAFVAKNLAGAMNRKEIPKVINISALSREGSSDFVVYTWENRISKADKAKARRKGDRSYINKGLFQKVYYTNEDGLRVPLVQVSEYKGKVYQNFIYKHVNAWGDSFRANEFYNFIKPSVLDNDFIKVEEKFNDETGVKISSAEVTDDVIANIYLAGTKTEPKIETGTELKTDDFKC